MAGLLAKGGLSEPHSPAEAMLALGLVLAGVVLAVVVALVRRRSPY